MFGVMARGAAGRLELQAEQCRSRAERLEKRRASLEELHTRGFGSQQELQQAEDDLAGAKLALLSAEEAFGQALQADTELLRELVLSSPVDGQVTEVQAREREVADPTQPLVRIAGAAAGFDVAIPVPVEKAEYVGVGDRVELAVKALSGKLLPGRVREIRDTAQNRGVSSDLVIDLDPSPALRGGELAELRLVKTTPAYPLLVVNSGVFTSAEGAYLWVVKERRGTLGTEYAVVRSLLQVLDSDAFRSAVSGGIGAQERYVIHASKPLDVGTAVRIE
jgi:multidrug efflux pump subunit AcrA (membrane-fusion protein)